MSRPVDPFPNPWAQQEALAQQRPRSDSDGSLALFQFYYNDVDGQLLRASSSSRSFCGRACLLNCCPCAAPARDGSTWKRWWRFVKTFCFMATMVQVCLMVASFIVGGGFAPVKNNYFLGPDGESLITMGAKYAPLIRWKKEGWRLFTSMWLHAGIIHLLLNAWAQLRFGVTLESRYGWWRMAIVFILSGLGGAIASCIVSPSTISVGASGAIAGQMGILAVEIFLRWGEMDEYYRLSAAIQSIVAVVLLIGIGFIPLVDAGAHAGGLIVGALLGAAYFGFFADPANTIRALPWPVVRRSLPWVSLFLLVVYFGVGLALVFAVINPPKD